MSYRNSVIEHRVHWQKKRREEFDAAFANFQNQMRQIEHPEDPRDQPEDVKAYRRSQLRSSSIGVLQAAAKGLLEQTDLGVKEAHAEYQKGKTRWEGSFDYGRVGVLKDEFLTQIRSAQRHEIERMTAEAQQSTDQNTRRAYRSALRQHTQEKLAKHDGDTQALLWFNQQQSFVKEWEAKDEPEELTWLRDTANEWSRAGNELFRELARKQNEVEPKQIWSPGVFDRVMQPFIDNAPPSVPVAKVNAASWTAPAGG